MNRRRRVFAIQALPIFLGVLLAGACSRGKEKTKGELPAAQPPKPQDPFSRSQVDVGLVALEQGSELRITIENKTANSLLIGPKNFGIIVVGKKDLFKFPEIAPKFPVQKLNSHEQVVGLLPLGEMAGNAAGARLVFDHGADCQPAMALIKSATAAVNVAPQN